ncbi:ADP-dependent glucokinase/phosphofructokinase [Salinilacihabitans rarus]|uniref:ADP-dependent glucokinase/phosphofructokinase n=1 Tax=Salinilacihabitans rarus TaxID=2961596 RepID=UPI0020C8B2E2|nr:ADP-dependent glucokinase/phosphofructokinase [Salinilacihabitans rarus]
MSPDAGFESDVRALDGLSVFVAYNANVDAIVRVDDELASSLERPAAPGVEPPPSRLDSTRDLAAGITHAMAAGRGDEAAMTDAFAGRIESKLEPDSRRMGGQTGIMTDLAATLGASPVAYTYLLSDRQRSLFRRPEAVRYPRVEDGRVRFVPLADAPTAERTKTNWVFEFTVGDELFGVRATENGRFIAASRPPEFDLRAGDLDAHADQVGEVVDGALLAGYHNLVPEHHDYARAHRHARDVVRRLRSGGDLHVHVEYAVTHDDDLRASIYERILPEANVVGTDTRELALLHDDADLDVTGAEPTEETPFEASEIVTHYRMLSALRDALGVDCIRVHAMQYHLAVMDSYLPPEAVRRGLAFAAVNAATKAARGDVAAPEDLATGATYEPSAKGREAIELLADHVGATTDDGALRTPTVVACPNRVVDDPARTVGIGDVVSASSFLLELAVADDIGPGS